VSSDWALDSDNAVASSAEKRALFAGAISDLFVQRPQTDGQDLEEVLLQIMEDEFCTVVEDGSERDVANAIVRVREECLRGEFGGVARLEEQWRVMRGVSVRGVRAEDELEEESESDDDEDEEEDEGDDDGDVNMGEEPVPQLVERKRAEPEVDEDGFTKVVGRRKR
jgi:pre-rRNA-processing protein TSR2